MTFTRDRVLSARGSAGAATDEPLPPAVEDFRGAPRPGDTLQIGFAGTRYELVRSLGRGGYAEVFLARQLGPEGFVHEVALKCILAGLDADDSARREFLYEARLASRLRHPNIAAAHDLAVSDDRYYLALEYVDGLTVRAAMKAARAAGTRPSVGFSLHVAASVAEALHHAHALASEDGTPLGIVHRDVTAANVMVSRSGVVKLLDFGVALARLEGRERTRTGQFRGTCAYASPEQARGEVLDGRSDLFSLGLVLVELLTGERVFEETSDWDSMRRVAECSPADVAAATAGLPPSLAAICAKALERDPADRFQDGASFSRALREYLTKAGVTYGQADCAAELASLAAGDGEPAERTAVDGGDPQPRGATASRSPARTKRRRILVASGGAAAVVLGALLLFGARLAEGRRTGTPAPRATASSSAPPTAVALPMSPKASSPQPTSASRAPQALELRAAPPDGEPIVRPKNAAITARAPQRARASPADIQRGQAPSRSSFADFADRTTVASARATLPRGTLVAARLLKALTPRGAGRAEAVVTEDIAADGVVLVPKGATLSCSTRPAADGRVPLACDTISTQERVLAFSGVAVGEGQHVGLRLRDEEIAAGTPFVVYVSAPAAVR